MTDRYEMRAADSDRDRIAEILRDAHGEGRLTQDELLARIEATYTAKTYRDLDQQIADLPLPRRPMTNLVRPASAPRPAPRRVGRSVARSLLTVAWWIYATVLAINLTVWLLVSLGNGGPEHFWPIWVAGPWGVVLTMAEIAYRARSANRG